MSSLLVTELISSTDEKEKQDPLAFRDAIIQGLQEIGNNDLDQVSAYFVVVLQNHPLIKINRDFSCKSIEDIFRNS